MTGRMTALLCTAAAICAPLGHLRAIQSTTPNEDRNRQASLRLVLGMRDFGSVSSLRLSPDAAKIAYTVQNHQRITLPSGSVLYTPTGVPFVTQGTDVWVSDLASGQARNITGETGSSWAPVWSHDGKRLAFYSDRDGAARLWVWDRDRNDLRRVSALTVRPWFSDEASWALGDTSIITSFLPAGLTLADGERQAMDVPGAYVTHSSPVVRVYENKPKDAANQRDLPRLQGYKGSNNGVLRTYAMVDVASGRVATLFTTTVGVMNGVSADGSLAAVSEMTGAAPDAFDQALYDIKIIALRSGKVTVAASDVPMAYGQSVSWSPVSTAHLLAYVTGSVARGNDVAGMTTRRFGPLGQCVLVDADTMQVRQLTANDTHPSFAASSAPPLWEASGEALYYLTNNQVWRSNIATGRTALISKETPLNIRSLARSSSTRTVAKHGQRMYALVQDVTNHTEGLAQIDLDTGLVTAPSLRPEHLGGYDTFPLFDSSSDGRVIAIAAETETKPRDIWATNAALSTLTRVTRLNPEMERQTFGATRLVQWRTSFGQDMAGALMLPVGYVAGRRYPTVIIEYPGAFKSGLLHHFDDSGTVPYNYQLLAAHGYAVFLTDFPVKSAMDLVPGGLAMRIMDSVVDQLVAIGIVEPTKIGVQGGSAGGHAALAFITQSTRFAAAVDDSGLASRLSAYTEFNRNGDAFYVQQEERIHGGTPWQARDAFIANSPFFFLDRVETPVLIIHGDASPFVMQKEADDVYVALRRLGKEATYALYAGAGHGLARFSYEQQVDAWERILDWYDAHLRFR